MSEDTKDKLENTEEMTEAPDTVPVEVVDAEDAKGLNTADDTVLSEESGSEDSESAADSDTNDAEITAAEENTASSAESDSAETVNPESDSQTEIRENPDAANAESSDKSSEHRDANVSDRVSGDDDGMVEEDEPQNYRVSSGAGVRLRRWLRKRKLPKIPPKTAAYGITVAAVLLIAIVASFLIGNWKYGDYQVVSSRKQEDTLSADYCAVDGNILRYSSDGASLSDRDGELIWDTSYTMSDPAVTLCGTTIAIYDRNGTGIAVCDSTGRIGSISTSLPIIKASVSEAGNVVVIQEDDSNAWIDYYAKNGNQIAAIKTSMDDPGYPLDAAVSRDGELVSVSYMNVTGGAEKAVVHVYSFGNAGQNQMDNRIGGFEYNEKIIPQLDYLTGSMLLAYTEDGFSIYEGAKTPVENVHVTIEEEIASVFHDDQHIGFILNAGEGEGYILRVYDLNGKVTLDKEFQFIYQKLDFVANEVTLYNGSNFCVYNLNGANRFNGTYRTSMQEIFALGSHRYVVVKETSLDVIRLQ